MMSKIGMIKIMLAKKMMIYLNLLRNLVAALFGDLVALADWIALVHLFIIIIIIMIEMMMMMMRMEMVILMMMTTPL